MNKRFLLLFASLIFSINLCFSQSDLKEIILNKKNSLPLNWVKSIQEKGTWEFQKAVMVKKKKVKDHYLVVSQAKCDELGRENFLSVFSKKSLHSFRYGIIF